MEDSISVGKVEAKKKNSILCKLKVTGPDENQSWAKISLATDTGVRKEDYTEEIRLGEDQGPVQAGEDQAEVQTIWDQCEAAY